VLREIMKTGEGPEARGNGRGERGSAV